MPIKVERRGKYAGVKLHLEPKHCEVFRKWWEQVQAGQDFDTSKIEHLSEKIGALINELFMEDLTLYQDRTEEQVKETLMKEYVESEKKLTHIKEGLDWKKIKVEVIK